METAAFIRKIMILAGGAGALALAACGPDFRASANRLREENIKLTNELSAAKADLRNRDQTIRVLREQLQGNAPPIETLPAARLDALVTASRLEIRSQTNAWEFETGKGLAGFRVFIRTLADDGTNLPATGALTLEAFDLAAPPAQPKRLGTWTFTPAEMKKNWYPGMGLNQFAFSCPWDAPPESPNITFRATFTDALTGRTLVAQLDKEVLLPSKSPATSPHE
jgi:hypothetical protein